MAGTCKFLVFGGAVALLAAFVQIGVLADDDKVDPEELKKSFQNANLLNESKYDSATLSDDLEHWQAPEFIQKNYPYYLSGYDYEDRPIWVCEFGKFNFRAALNEGGTITDDLEKWMQKMIYEARKSREAKGVEELVFILDFEGFTLQKYSHAPTLAYLIRFSRRLADVAQKRVGQTLILNANYATKLIVDLMRPIFGRVYEHLEVYGTNKERWIPEMRKRFPVEALPPWYGGKKSYKPVKTFG